jgi:hypothetical protein
MAYWVPPDNASQLTDVERRLLDVMFGYHNSWVEKQRSIREEPIPRDVFYALIPENEAQFEHLRQLVASSRVSLWWLTRSWIERSFAYYRASVACRCLENPAPWLLRVPVGERYHCLLNSLVTGFRKPITASGMEPEDLMKLVMTPVDLPYDDPRHGAPLLLYMCTPEVLMMLIESFPTHPERFFPVTVAIMTGSVALREEYGPLVRRFLPPITSTQPNALSKILSYYGENHGGDLEDWEFDDALVRDIASFFRVRHPHTCSYWNLVDSVLNRDDLDRLQALANVIDGFDPDHAEIGDHEGNLIQCLSYRREIDLVVWAYKRGCRPNEVTIATAVVIGIYDDWGIEGTGAAIGPALERLEAEGIPIYIQRQRLITAGLTDTEIHLLVPARLQECIGDESDPWLRQHGFLLLAEEAEEEELLVKPAASRVRDDDD